MCPLPLDPYGNGEGGFDLEVLEWELEWGRRCGGSNVAMIMKDKSLFS